MPSLIDIRRRIRAVRSTQQITKAMKTVATSRLRRAQERMLQARPFAAQMLRVLQGVAARIDPAAHPLLEARDDRQPGSRTVLVVLTADKGLCGSFNANILKAAGGFILEREDRRVSLAAVGRKGRDFFRRRGLDICYERTDVFTRLSFAHAQELARTVIDQFSSRRAEAVYVLYNEFKSMLQQRVVVEPVLPIPRADLGEAPAAARVDYLFEPAPERILGELLPHHVEFQLYRALLESAAAEHAARMVAMDNATKNSAEMIDRLTLYMNKVRQAGITREIIEVVSGAQAL